MAAECPVRPGLVEVAGRFRAAVEQLGTQATVASLIGCSPSTLKRYVAGRTRPSDRAIEVVAHASGRTVEWVLHGERREGSAPAPAGDPRLTWLENERDVAMRAMLDAARRVESFTEAINALKAVAIVTAASIDEIARDIRAANRVTDRIHLAAHLLTGMRHVWVMGETIDTLEGEQTAPLARLILRDALEDLERTEVGTPPGEGSNSVARAHLEQRARALLQLDELSAHVRSSSSPEARWCDVAELTEVNRMVGEALGFAKGRDGR